MLKQQPFGRWNREPRHVLEVINDGPASWFVCTCGAQGEIHTDGGKAADAEAVNHELAVWMMHKEGLRYVRGRME
jgi:hypothetical protein